MNENTSKNAKFIAFAEKRVEKALKSISLVGNLANRSTYSYTDEQVKKIVQALKSEVAEVEGRFKSHTKGGTKFKL